MSRTEPRSRAAKAAARDYVSNIDGERSTAARILRAAEELLGERGYDGVSMRDVAERAGITKALIFYHFRSKDDLFGTVLDRYYEAHTQALQTSLDIEGTPRERIRRMLEAYLTFIYQNRLYPRLVQQEIARGAQNLDKIQKNFHALFEAVAKHLHGVVPAEGPLSAKHFFLSFASMVINYFTYAPVLGPVWGDDPMSERSRDERRRHILWTVDTFLDRLDAERASGAWPVAPEAPPAPTSAPAPAIAPSSEAPHNGG
jgi:AcrR family transcriptional regulator